MRFVYIMKWSKSDVLLLYQDKIYVSNNSDLYYYIIFLYHDSKIAEHTEWWKTLELVSWNYWWSQISRYMLWQLLDTKSNNHISK